jgi:uncharacterized membrane protein
MTEALPRHRRVHHGTFGNDRFGVLAERFAPGFGTPQFIVGQTVLVALWIAANAVAFSLRWDPYPFILLNLAFSTQAAYAAPPILPNTKRRSSPSCADAGRRSQGRGSPSGAGRAAEPAHQ